MTTERAFEAAAHADTPALRTWVARVAPFAKVDMVRSCEVLVRRFADDAPEGHPRVGGSDARIHRRW
ncbi:MULTISPECIES: hypothetical protein [Variovorax]|uniref:hypothetical protein n=1 Tax=Variovorax TaxID=34072 RepID=UPI000AAC0212|nr:MULTISPECIES: hypothetical protein [Variovorax]MBN8752516.1 hypothetical protein [Variovorax sp.]UKI06752.1 hypothetical protein L3V85_28680 [Variovorax paradoxus]